jgi:hypothetical protein
MLTEPCRASSCIPADGSSYNEVANRRCPTRGRRQATRRARPPGRSSRSPARQRRGHCRGPAAWLGLAVPLPGWAERA